MSNKFHENQPNKNSVYETLCASGAGDVKVKISTKDATTGDKKEEEATAHSFILMSSSPYFQNLISAALLRNGNDIPQFTTIEVDFGSIPDAAVAFKSILHFLHTGEFIMNSVDPAKIIEIARLCRIVAFDQGLLRCNKILQQISSNMPFSSTLVSLYNDPQLMLDLTVLQALQSVQSNTLFSYFALAATINDGAGTLSSSSILAESFDKPVPIKAPCNNEIRDKCSTIITTPTIINLSDAMLPSSDQEGWCRNKKYIDRLENGFKCKVCQKVYGRYNSVSYHVTIYHRNPPIRCDVDTCQFTTREARYIHFHKYYRHDIPLPNTIDLGQRKCPFCRHVSKSPSMLGKHISRHLPEHTEVDNQTSSMPDLSLIKLPTITG